MGFTNFVVVASVFTVGWVTSERGIKYLVFSTGSHSLNHPLSVWSPWETEHMIDVLRAWKNDKDFCYELPTVWVFQMLTITDKSHMQEEFILS